MDASALRDAHRSIVYCGALAATPQLHHGGPDPGLGDNGRHGGLCTPPEPSWRSLSSVRSIAPNDGCNESLTSPRTQLSALARATAPRKRPGSLPPPSRTHIFRIVPTHTNRGQASPTASELPLRSPAPRAAPWPTQHAHDMPLFNHTYVAQFPCDTVIAGPRLATLCVNPPPWRGQQCTTHANSMDVTVYNTIYITT